ncbi:MAG: Ig-like domain-containing protein [Bdellovibrionales bacterium]|nr:Ig-like domain-containing protein [Bdellovibrionales bacterium]
MRRPILALLLLGLAATIGCNRMSGPLTLNPIGGINSADLACTLSVSPATQTATVNAAGDIVGDAPVFSIQLVSTRLGAPTRSSLVRVESNKASTVSGVPSSNNISHSFSYQAEAVGSHQIVATIIDSQTLTETAICSTSLAVQGVAGALESISIAPTPNYLPLGIFVDFSATGHYTDGSTADITESVTWASDRPLLAEFSANAPGRLIMISEGSLTISAALGGISENHAFEIGAAVLESLTVAPLSNAIPLGRTLQLIATGLYSDASTVGLTNAVTWTSSAPNIASVSNSGSRGIVTASALGTAIITATVNGIGSNAAVVNVIPPVLGAITIQPTTVQLEVGHTLQLHAIASFSDGSTADVSSTTAWSANNSRIQINSAGLLTGVTAGSATITASYQGFSATRAATVTQTVLQSLSLSPTNPTIDEGETISMVATGHYSDGSTANVTANTSWSSSSTAVATVANSGAARGTVTGVSEGSATITATLSGISATTSVTVQSKQLYFVYTHKGDVDVSLNDIVGSNHDFQNFNFKTTPFKIKISTRLLSRINYAGKQSYELADMDLRQSINTYAEIYSITRNYADRASGGGSCTIVPSSVFERHRMDSSVWNGGSYLNLSSGSGNQYIYEYEARERYAVSNQGCYPSIHSGRRDAWGASIAAPRFDQSPWPYDGYSNTYGNGAFVYVNASGQLRFWYKTQQQASRVVFLVAIRAQ